VIPDFEEAVRQRAAQAPGIEIKKMNKTVHLGTFLAILSDYPESTSV